MALFLSTFDKQIDKKGRISVPPAFRTVLASESYSGVVVFGSFVHECIEACSMARMEQFYTQIESLDPFSEERDAFSTAILGGAVQLPFDSEGRITLPEHLLDQAGIDRQCMFVGKGAAFEIWSPKAFIKHQEAARALAKSRRGVLKASPVKAPQPPAGTVGTHG
jgi:MraZ protein